MPFSFSCISYLLFGTEIARETKTQATVTTIVLNPNQQQRARSIYSLHRFSGRRHQKIIEVMMLIKITGESVKCIESKHFQESLIKTILQLYISYLNKLHSHFITFHFVNYDQSTP